MVALNALHGRTRLTRAKRGCTKLVVLLLATFAVLVLAQLADMDAAQAARTSGWTFTAAQISALGAPIRCASPLLAGILIDRFGLRRIVAFALIGWCAVTTLGTTTLPPLAFAVLAPLTFDLLVGVVLTAALVALRLALAPRRRAPAIALILVAYGLARSRSFALYASLSAASSGPVALAMATCATLVVAAWLLFFREVDPAAGLDLPPPPRQRGTLFQGVADVASRPIVWGLLLIQLCHSVVYGLVFDQYWTFELMRQGAIDPAVLIPDIAAPLATIVAAIWSDWALRRNRSLSRARSPFVVLGFVAAAVAGLAATRAHESAAGLALMSGASIGAIRMIGVLEIDLAPRALAGRFLGFLGAGEAFLALYIAPIIASVAGQPQSKTTVLVGVSVLAAGVALWTLRRLPEISAA